MPESPITPGSTRTTEELIREIIEVDSSISTLFPFMEAAHSVVEAQCNGIEEEDATQVETWLSAHFITIRDTRRSSEKVDTVAEAYQYKVDLMLSSSMYGQTAMSLDPTGGLARWSKMVVSGKAGKTVAVGWLGTDYTL